MSEDPLASGGGSRRAQTEKEAESRRTLAWSVVAYAVVVGVWVLVPRGPASERELLSDLAPLPVGLAAWVGALSAARRSSNDAASARAWSRIAAAFLLWWLGDLLWFILEVGLDRSPFPSPADVCYLATYPVLAWGLLSFPGVRRLRSERIKVALDAATVLLSGAMVVWYLVVGPIVGDSSGRLATILNVAYPAGDLLLLYGVVAVLLGHHRQQSLWLLLGGVVALILADLGYARLSLTGSYQGGDWPDAFWVLSGCLFVLASTQWCTSRRPAARVPSGVSNLPYGAVVLGYVVLFAVGRSDAGFELNGLLVGAAAITGTVMARQIRVTAENVRLVAELHHLAAIDGLTSILNRRTFCETGDRLVAAASAAEQPLTFLMIDVDHFKLVNDTFGHATGDQVLVEVANRTKQQLRDGDVVGRYGGDELGVLIPECRLDEGVEVAERIRRAITTEPIATADGQVYASLSIGVAEARPGRTFPDVVAQADIALYQAKQAGRGCTRAAA